jgi:hypothetical protein
MLVDCGISNFDIAEFLRVSMVGWFGLEISATEREVWGVSKGG